MGILTWIPGDLRERLASIDPARTPPVTMAKPSLSEIVSQAATAPAALDEPGVRVSRRGKGNAALAAAAVGVVAVGVVTVRGVFGGAPQTHTASRLGGPSSGAPSITTPVSVAAAPPEFPVTAQPRPIVVLGETVLVSGFPDSDTKIAFMDGDIDLDTPLPDTPTERNGYQLMPASRAVQQISDVHSCCVTTTTRLRITSVTLTDRNFETDRGTRSLPVWRIHFAGVPKDVYVLAVAPSARFPDRLNGYASSAGEMVSSNGGRDLTIVFVAHHVATGPCDQGYRSSLALSQTSSAVRIAVTVTNDPIPSPTPGATPVICSGVAYGVALPPGGLRPGAPNTATIKLDAPLGNRLVVNGRGAPYLVTNR